MGYKEELIKKLRTEGPEVQPDQVKGVLESGANGRRPVLVDVRETDEYRAGHLPGALHLPRGFLELQAEGKLPQREAEIIAYCAGGTRSLLAADTLRKMGYQKVKSMAGGFTRWKQNGFPFDVPQVLTERGRERHARYLSVDEAGGGGG